MSGTRTSTQHSETEHKRSHTAGAISGIVTGGLEAVTMFPFDRYKNLRQLGIQVWDKKSVSELFTKVLWKDILNYRGLTPYIFHKIGARTLVLGMAQPFFFDTLRKSSFYSNIETQLGKDNAKTGAATIAGGLAGMTEVILNPLDRWKLLCQKDKMTASVALQQIQKEGFKIQYAGWRETMKRNMLGTSATFYGKFAAYKILNVEDHTKPSFAQSFGSNVVAATFRISTSHLADLAKNRAQMNPEKNNIGIFTRTREIAKKEGLKALYAGAFSKLASTGTKFCLALTLFDWVSQKIDKELPSLTEKLNLGKK